MAHRITIPRNPKDPWAKIKAALQNASLKFEYTTQSVQAFSGSLHEVSGLEYSRSQELAKQADMILGMRPSLIIRDEISNFRKITES
jgi:hypothetical protein